MDTYDRAADLHTAQSNAVAYMGMLLAFFAWAAFETIKYRATYGHWYSESEEYHVREQRRALNEQAPDANGHLATVRWAHELGHRWDGTNDPELLAADGSSLKRKYVPHITPVPYITPVPSAI